jgi:hypothetical protein
MAPTIISGADDGINAFMRKTPAQLHAELGASDGINAFMHKAPGQLARELGDAGKSIAQPVAEGIKGVAGESIAQPVAGGIKDMAGKAITGVKNTINKAVTGVKNTINKVAPRVETTISKAAPEVSNDVAAGRPMSLAKKMLLGGGALGGIPLAAGLVEGVSGDDLTRYERQSLGEEDADNIAARGGDFVNKLWTAPYQFGRSAGIFGSGRRFKRSVAGNKKGQTVTRTKPTPADVVAYLSRKAEESEA